MAIAIAERQPVAILNVERLDYEMARRELTAKDLAQLSGITEAAISRIRRGHARPTLRTLRRLIDTLGEVPVRKDLDLILQPPVAGAGKKNGTAGKEVKNPAVTREDGDGTSELQHSG